MSHLRQISPWTRAMVGIVALAAAAIAVIVATAGSADANDADPEARGDVTFMPGPPPEVIEDFKNCMSEHGVDVPEPGEPFDGEPGVHEPSAEAKQAFEACEDELPAHPPEGGAVMLAPRPDGKAFREFRDCMSDHGADVPKPPARPGRRELHEPSAAEQDAFEACGDKLPAPPLGGCPPPGRPQAPGMSDDE
jgi:hypothetical protein